MKTLLIDPQWQSKKIGPKLSVCCLASAVKDLVEVDILEFLLSEANINEITDKPYFFWRREQEFLSTIERKLLSEPEIGIVAITGWSGAFPRILRIVSICKAVRPDVKIVVGGPHVTLYERYSDPAQSILQKYPNIDFVIAGEGEKSFRELVITTLLQKNNYNTICGLVWRNCEEVIRNNSKLSSPSFLSGISPLWQEGDMNNSERRLFFVESGRGCPNHCAFCDESDLWGKYRPRSAISVVDDIESGINFFSTSAFRFADSTFTANPHFDLICNEIISRQLGVFWSAFAHSREITENKADLLAESGCKCILMGIESGSQKILESMRKRTSTEIISKSVKILKSRDIQVRGSFIVGFPREKKEDILKTIDFACELNLDAYAWHVYQEPFYLSHQRHQFLIDFAHYELDAPFEVCLQILERNSSLLSDMHTLPKLVALSKDIEPIPEKWPRKEGHILEMLKLAINKTSESRNHDFDMLINLAEEYSVRALTGFSACDCGLEQLKD